MVFKDGSVCILLMSDNRIAIIHATFKQKRLHRQSQKVHISKILDPKHDKYNINHLSKKQNVKKLTTLSSWPPSRRDLDQRPDGWALARKSVFGFENWMNIQK